MSDPITQTDILDEQNDEIVAIETELGTSPSGADATVAARLTRIDAPVADYTPSWRQAVTLTKTITRARYWVPAAGGICHVSIDMTATSAGTAANELVVSLPVAALDSSAPCGVGIFYDASATQQYPAYVQLVGADFKLFPTNALGLSPLGVAQFTGAVAAGDIIRANFSYPRA